MGSCAAHRSPTCGARWPQSLEQIGEWWSLLIIRDALLGVRRFEDFRTRLGIASNILTSRLDTLVAHGILDVGATSEHPPATSTA